MTLIYIMRLAIISICLFSVINVYSNKSYDLYTVEKKILSLSIHLDAEMMNLSMYNNLQVFCSDIGYRQAIFGLLDQIHEYHDMLEKELQTTTYNHSKRTISRILKHMDHLDKKYNPDDFTSFFTEQCSIQSNIEKNSDHYKAGFASHSYGSKVYAQEVVMYRYLKRLTKRVKRIKRHVEHFSIRRKVWEH